ncbi:MAG TPA: hypothetical protein VKH46_14385, partial [Thermoanaerobaculia bacterium]|nr:hypothetical protein [Thermoanaerobaculia bacterium]
MTAGVGAEPGWACGAHGDPGTQQGGGGAASARRRTGDGNPAKAKSTNAEIAPGRTGQRRDRIIIGMPSNP